jgi:hypothetical protein
MSRRVSITLSDMKKKLSIILAAFTFMAGSSRAGSDDYTLHEWGTFTSVQCADGKQIAWNPLSAEELPDFVYSLVFPQGKGPGKEIFGVAKTGFQALQRMETPVIYFYSDTPRTVDVNVNFPEGNITEWYPQSTSVNPYEGAQRNPSIPNRGKIRWSSVSIMPKGSKEAVPMGDLAASHYYSARETEANLLKVASKNGTEVEKFLFYRGVGNFQAPLNAQQQGETGETIQLSNPSKEPLSHLFVYQIKGGQATWSLVPKLEAGDSKVVHMKFDSRSVPVSQFHEQIAPQLEKALVEEGLFAAEAKAMVKTWDSSWLSEQGMRVLYTIPLSATDRLLPLTAKPAPDKVTRVMVARAEMITPEQEYGLLREMVRFTDGGEAQKRQAVENTLKLGLGRFAEPVMRRLLASGPKTREFSNKSWDLLVEVWRAESKSKRLAQN